MRECNRNRVGKTERRIRVDRCVGINRRPASSRLVGDRGRRDGPRDPIVDVVGHAAVASTGSGEGVTFFGMTLMMPSLSIST
jgi:hypothetical protein